MAKKNARKPSGAAGIATIEDSLDDSNDTDQLNSAASGGTRKGKGKADPQASEQFGVSDVRKAAAFVNSIGGLDKAIAVLQILKVAKEVQ